MNKEESGRLRGVSSGAAIWGAGEIGVACGLGYLKEAAFITALIFAILNLYGWVQRLFEKPDKPQGDDEQSSTENS